jgi:hypothetical protein
VKNRFRNLPFKCNLQRYTMGDGLIPAPKEIWAKRRPTVGAAFHGGALHIESS